MQKAFGKEQGIELYQQIETLSSTINSQHNKLANELEDRKANLISTLASVSEQSDSESNNKVEAFKDFVTQSQQSIEEQFNAIQTKLVSDLEQVFSNLQTQANETYGNFENQFKELHSTGVEETTGILGKEKESIQSTANKFIEISEGVLGKINAFSEDTTIPELFDGYNADLERLTGDFEKISKATLNNVSEELTKAIKEIHSSLKTAEKESKNKVSKLTTDLQQINKEVHSNAISTLESVIKLADEKNAQEKNTVSPPPCTWLAFSPEPFTPRTSCSCCIPPGAFGLSLSFDCLLSNQCNCNGHVH